MTTADPRVQIKRWINRWEIVGYINCRVLSRHRTRQTAENAAKRKGYVIVKTDKRHQ